MILSATFAADRAFLLGDEHHAHAALADLLHEPVAADRDAGTLGEGELVEGRGQLVRHGLQELLFLFVDLEQCLDALAQSLIAGANLVEVLAAGVRVLDLPRCVEDPLFIQLSTGHGSTSFAWRRLPLHSTMRNSSADSLTESGKIRNSLVAGRHPASPVAARIGRKPSRFRRLK